jgi:hypothetical protein
MTGARNGHVRGLTPIGSAPPERLTRGLTRGLTPVDALLALDGHQAVTALSPFCRRAPQS